MNVINEEPNVYTIDNFITQEECSHLIELSKDNIQQSLVSGDSKGYVSERRSGQNCWIKHDTDKIVLNICKKISQQVNIPLENAESIQVIYYSKDQQYYNHLDGWEFDNSEKSRRNMKWGGQRMITALCYLNTVEEGGGTRFSKLDKIVNAEKGKLLVFSNVINNSNIRHPLSEHAGMPVIEGEKWAFNLWFREKRRNVEYKYPTNIPQNLEEKIKDIIDITPINNNNVKLNINLDSNIVSTIDNFIDIKDIDSILKNTTFEDKDRSSCWIQNNKLPNFIKKVSNLINIDSSYFENVSITKYKNVLLHKDHLDSYDLTSENGKKYTKIKGQRLLTFSVFLSPTRISFPKIKEFYNCSPGTAIFYNNCFNKSNKRNTDMIKSYQQFIENNNIDNNDIDDDIDDDIENKNEEMMVLNLYVREKINDNSKILVINNLEREYIDKVIDITDTQEDIKEKNVIPNYPLILSNIYSKNLQHNLNVQNFKMINKGTEQYTIETINKLDELKQNNGFLIQDNINKKYFINEYNPVVVENVLTPEIHKTIDEYFKVNIKNEVYKLGDRQSNRYKVLDEIMTRLLHLEFLPLIEKITERKMEATYTYLSAYQKGTNLPPHTDRPECEFTCSYIIGKPENSNWNIYFHKIKQPEKYKGRYNFTPDKNECIPVDCNENGLMIFNGTDHIHFREELPYDYYNIVLLHYRSI